MSGVVTVKLLAFREKTFDSVVHGRLHISNQAKKTLLGS